jgi:hypothetical protein
MAHKRACSFLLLLFSEHLSLHLVHASSPFIYVANKKTTKHLIARGLKAGVSGKKATKNHELSVHLVVCFACKKRKIYPFEDALIDRQAEMPIFAPTPHLICPGRIIRVRPF